MPKVVGKPRTELRNRSGGNISATSSGPTRESGIKARGWMITINNPTAEEEKLLLDDDWVYLMYQHEVGRECKTPHLHAVFWYKNPRVWPKKRYPRADIGPVRDAAGAIKYCSKEETRVRGPFEFGIRPHQGQAEELIAMCNAIKEGKSVDDVAAEYPTGYVRFHRGLDRLKERLMKHRTSKPRVVWRWGKTGLGKSREPAERHPSHYMKDNTIWWNDYEQQEAIILNDFDGKRWEVRDLLNLLDRYKFQGQTKGGYVRINSPYIYITCDKRPEYYWSGDILAQVMRRIDEIVEVIG